MRTVTDPALTDPDAGRSGHLAPEPTSGPRGTRPDVSDAAGTDSTGGSPRLGSVRRQVVLSLGSNVADSVHGDCVQILQQAVDLLTIAVYLDSGNATYFADLGLAFAILGLIALSGILMRNTLILVDEIHHDQAAGLRDYDAIVESTVRRARPVILTAAAAMLAFIPLTHSVFWGALAYVLIGGVGVGTLMTLLFLPALYALWFRVAREPRERKSAAGADTSPAPTGA